jgi:hypothetical protein
MNKKLLNKLKRDLVYQSIENKLLLVFGIVYLLSFIGLTIYKLNHAEELGIRYSERIFGIYAFAYCAFPLCYLAIIMIRQLKSKFKWIVLLIFSMLALIPMETVVLTLAWHRDFLPSGIFPENSLWFIWLKIGRNYLLCLLIYIIIVEMLYRIKKSTYAKHL